MGNPESVSDRNFMGVVLRLLLAGDLDTATELYEERGRSVADPLFIKVQFTDGAQVPGAAMYERARDFVRAARLQELGKRWFEAARLWEEAGDAGAAARCWREGGDLRKAAAALQAAGQLDEAARLYAGLNQFSDQATALARDEQWLQSAAAYRAAGNPRAEADALRTVPLEHRDRVPAVKRLSELLILRNRAQEAAELVGEVLRENESGRADAELHEVMAALFDRLEQPAQAERLRVRAQRLRARQQAPAVELQPPSPAELQRITASQSAGGTDYRFLKQVPIFARLSMDDMRDLFRLMEEQTWRPGEPLVDVGVEAPGLVVLLEGSAEVYALSAEGHRHLNSVGPGAHLGEISLLTGSLTSARVMASTVVRGLALSRERFELFLSCHPAAALKIYRLFSEHLAERVRALSVQG